MRSGKLTIVCFEAELTRDTELLGKMSPYLEVTVGGLTLQTEKHKEAGKVPNWKGEELNFQLRNVSDFHYKVMGYELTGNHDLVGSHMIKVRNIPQGKHTKKVPIYYDNTQVGLVKLGFIFQHTAEAPTAMSGLNPSNKQQTCPNSLKEMKTESKSAVSKSDFTNPDVENIVNS